MTLIKSPSDIDLVVRRAQRTLDLLGRDGSRTWRVTKEWEGPLRAAGLEPSVSGGGGPGSVGYSSPTERAVVADDPLAGLHRKYRAALSLLVDALAAVEDVITSAAVDPSVARRAKSDVDDAALWCSSCDRVGAREPKRREGGRWCRWCEDLVRDLVAGWGWEAGTAPPRSLVHRRRDPALGRVTQAHIAEAMRKAGLKPRAVTS